MYIGQVLEVLELLWLITKWNCIKIRAVRVQANLQNGNWQLNTVQVSRGRTRVTCILRGKEYTIMQRWDKVQCFHLEEQDSLPSDVKSKWNMFNKRVNLCPLCFWWRSVLGRNCAYKTVQHSPVDHEAPLHEQMACNLVWCYSLLPVVLLLTSSQAGNLDTQQAIQINLALLL